MARSRQSLLLVLASILAVATGEDAAAAELAVDAAGPAPSLSRDRLVGFISASELLRRSWTASTARPTAATAARRARSAAAARRPARARQGRVRARGRGASGAEFEVFELAAATCSSATP